ncbi:MAG TPA: gamma-glutamyltransferase [Xanthobacteraceae bacterium]|nr:gamma-glutamyltransferase [Xanthobacteraceae bacterium]
MRILAAALLSLLATEPPVLAQKAAPIAPVQGLVAARNGMVVAEEARAARIGVDILKRGGNAVDAAVAVGFALAVTLPYAGNLGGGGFMLVRLAHENKMTAIDYRETAPAGTKADTFLDVRGEADPKKSREEGVAIGVPGTVAGLAFAHRQYGSGKFTLAELIAPAIELARGGIVVDVELADAFAKAKPLLARWPSTAAIFLHPDGSPFGEGELLVQRDLASTLEEIARQGPEAFYAGRIAEQIARSVQAAGGVMTREDIARYQALERAPVAGNYRGYDIFSMPPPSSGGVHLLQILNILEGYDLSVLGAASIQGTHLMVEAMKLAYADRARFLGDPQFVQVPVAGLLSSSYAAELRKHIEPEHALRADELPGGNPAAYEGDHTTHYSIVDGDGNAVANTYTLNLRFGAGLVAEGTGILLNNELDDFAAKPGAPNAFGLVGGLANAPGPGKKPLSSMAPTIVLKNGKLFLVTGSPGGSRIISTVVNVLVNVIDYKMNIAEATAAPRVHHQWLPDEVRVESGFKADVVSVLQSRGNRVVTGVPWGSAASIMVTKDGLLGAADPRSRGALAAGF